MVTINQLLKNARKGKRKKLIIKQRNKLTQPKCHISGVIKKRMTASPKKPNSAVRKVARVSLSDGSTIRVYVPGENNGVTEFSQVLLKRGRRKDLPGVNYIIVAGTRDAPAIEGRKQRRSLYGVKKPK